MSVPRVPIYCLNCSYCLVHTTEDKCPECGRAFNRKDMGTVRTEPELKLARWFKCVLKYGFAIMLLLNVALMVLDGRVYDSRWNAALAVVFLVGGAITFGTTMLKNESR